MYVERLDCLSGFDPLPEFTFLFYESPFNKLLLMDSTSAASLQIIIVMMYYKSHILQCYLCYIIKADTETAYNKISLLYS